MTTQKQIKTIFDLLDNWKHLQTYQLERRVDIFLALYLPEILNQPPFELGITHDSIIPEFPIAKTGSHLSHNVSYFAISEKKKTVYLIDLMIGTNSYNMAQSVYLKWAKEKDTMDLVRDVMFLSHVSTANKKYDSLLSVLEKFGFVEYVKREGKKARSYIYRMKKEQENYNVKIIYILPKKTMKSIYRIGDDDMVISFENIIKILENKSDTLTKRFVESLKSWIG